jgi:hypothetical protein
MGTKKSEFEITTDGTANFYGIASKEKWLMRIQLNGELTEEQQKVFLYKIKDFLNENEKVETSQYRDAYYKLADAINGFESVTDGVFFESRNIELTIILDEIYEHLNKNYIWD